MNNIRLFSHSLIITSILFFVGQTKGVYSSFDEERFSISSRTLESVVHSRNAFVLLAGVAGAPNWLLSPIAAMGDGAARYIFDCEKPNYNLSMSHFARNMALYCSIDVVKRYSIDMLAPYVSIPSVIAQKFATFSEPVQLGIMLLKKLSASIFHDHTTRMVVSKFNAPAKNSKKS